ncbi:MAG TPA: uracil-DNA glycosylase family protein [Leptospiraceae bacterium]|nr:uracil-DNA glycosylase family protein [Leptospiraceae bacterium]HMW05978.1 uracil-DNA glycosylase family protein [Leptospiraceae bacterium]HMX32090.1 uracil-DNA glycosylase family protein [Leptospiraceae bacterium]HMY32332.1 uracil-DNA glycosylase family protein [Leptospiraceae bacterium]HMZ62466.1 uracil-DNA glycosylase family protein [Leptospiraceae bacterium]
MQFKSYNEFVSSLLSCQKCKGMQSKPIVGSVKKAKIISIGQAPGIHEEKHGKPFSYTAGKTLFKWFASIGIQEEIYRQQVNMSAVCRCFPGKAKSGDRKPNAEEIENCSIYLKYEIQYHKPSLIIPIGKMAIDLLIGNSKYTLEKVIGNQYKTSLYKHEFDWIPLPHPSGLNVWNNTQIGKKLILKSLQLIQSHPATYNLIQPST